METKEILEKVRSGEISVDTAEKFFRQKPFEDLGFAKLDTHRKIRTGFGEVVFCSGKRDAHLKQIFQKLAEKEGNVLGTRASREQFELIRTLCPDAVYDPLARLVKVIRKPVELRGSVAVCTAGTADIPVAEEAAQTAEFFGSKVNRVYDVGVSGLHRLLASLDPIQEANCVIAVAGMEGALPSVLGGLVSNPVIAVPTSIGYGASLQGISAF